MELTSSGVGRSDLKRVRDEGSCVQREVDGLPTLQCPWCGVGRLLRMKDDDTSCNEYDSGVLCTSGSSCRNAEVIQGDSSMAFSGISSAALIRCFFAALDAHVESCSRNGHCKSVQRNRALCAWKVVAEQSPLFALLNNDSVVSRRSKCVTENESEEDAASCGTSFSMNDGANDIWTTAIKSQESRPVFYFLMCDDCGEMNFIC